MREKRKRRLPEGDDGHTIVNMNVEGMDGYRPGRRQEEALPEETDEKPKHQRMALTKQESRWMLLGSLKAVLVVAGAMSLGIVVFVLITLWAIGAGG